jgi:hypothetical protein
MCSTFFPATLAPIKTKITEKNEWLVILTVQLRDQRATYERGFVNKR